MENKKEKAINDFIDAPEKNNEDLDMKNVILDERSGLIERIDHQFVDKSGRMLLRD